MRLSEPSILRAALYHAILSEPSKSKLSYYTALHRAIRSEPAPETRLSAYMLVYTHVVHMLINTHVAYNLIYTNSAHARIHTCRVAHMLTYTHIAYMLVYYKVSDVAEG